METIDEREVDAVRFYRSAHEQLRDEPVHPSDVDWALAILLFAATVRHPEWIEIAAARNPFRNSSELNRVLADAVQPLLPGFIQAYAAVAEILGANVESSERDHQLTDRALDILRLAVSSEATAPLRYLRYRFDYVLNEMAFDGRGGPPTGWREEFVASLVAEFAATDGEILDTCTSTGDAGVRLAETGVNATLYVPEREKTDLDEYFPSVLFRMRMAAYHVDLRLVRSDEAAMSQIPSRVALFPEPFGIRRRHEDSEEQSGIGIARGLEAAVQFVRVASPSQRAFVGVTLRDLSVGGWSASVRQDLVRRGALFCVVELPTFALTRRTRVFLLGIRGQTNGLVGDEVLFIDGRAIDGLKQEGLRQLAVFLSIPLVEHERGRLFEDSQGRWERLGNSLSERADRLFSRGATAVDGFSASVPGYRLEDGGFNLVPEKWIPPKAGSSWQMLLESQPAEDLLRGAAGETCIYIIGDNGSGKSMLLRQLAVTRLEAGGQVCAIAFGMTDRFLHSSQSQRYPNYTYLGARTSHSAVDPRKLAQQAARLMLEMHQDQRRLAAFNDVSALLNFGAEHYLLPAGARSDFLQKVERLEDAKPDMDLGEWKLGMKRGENDIVPFDLLSSGEQQLLLLLARLVANANPGTVFVVDEPETSLHVAWQKQLPVVFRRVSDIFLVDIVVATHAPVVVAAATAERDFCFSARGGALELISQKDKRSVETALFEGFGTYTERNREVQERCAEIVAEAITARNAGRALSPEQFARRLKRMEHVIRRTTVSDSSQSATRDLRLIHQAVAAISELAAGSNDGASDEEE